MKRRARTNNVDINIQDARDAVKGFEVKVVLKTAMIALKLVSISINKVSLRNGYGFVNIRDVTAGELKYTHNKAPGFAVIGRARRLTPLEKRRGFLNVGSSLFKVPRGLVVAVLVQKLIEVLRVSEGALNAVGKEDVVVYASIRVKFPGGEYVGEGERLFKFTNSI